MPSQLRSLLDKRVGAAATFRLLLAEQRQTAQGRIASSEMLSDIELLPHLICSTPVGGGGDVDEAGQHGSAR